MKTHSLFSSIRHNSDEAIKLLYDSVYPNVRNYVLQNSGNEVDSQDLFQDGLVVLWQKVQYAEIEDQGDAQLKSLLYLICRRRWLDHLRSSKYKNQQATISIRQEESYEITDSDEITSEEIQKRWKVFEKLDARCQEVLKDFYLYGIDLQTIAQKWQMGYDTMKTTKYRCLEKARKLSNS